MRRCACGCDGSMEGKRPHAKWHSDACRERQKRRDRGSTGRIGRPPLPRYIVDPVTGCHEWLLARSEKGYGLVHHEGRTRIAHIVAWEEKHGPVPKGRELHHTCENKGCVNADHLEPLTRVEHQARHKEMARAA